MNVARFNVMFQLLILGWEKAPSALKDTNILGDGHPNVLLHSMKTIVKFLRPLKRITV